MGVRQLVAVVALFGVAAAILVLGIQRRSARHDAVLERLVGMAEDVDAGVLTSTEVEVLGVGDDAASVGLFLGDALVRRRLLAARGDLGDEAMRANARETLRWLSSASLRGSVDRWREELAEDPGALPPDRAVRGLERLLPDGSVAAGWWLGVLRLWPPSAWSELDDGTLAAAAAALDEADLPDEAAELRGRMERGLVGPVDLEELSRDATAVLLAAGG